MPSIEIESVLDNEHMWQSLLELFCKFVLFMILILPFILRSLPFLLLRKSPLAEIFMPKDQYNLFLYRNNRYITIRYHPIWLVIDVIRCFLVPAWIAVPAGIVCCIVIQDIFLESFILVIRLLFNCRSQLVLQRVRHL